MQGMGAQHKTRGELWKGQTCDRLTFGMGGKEVQRMGAQREVQTTERACGKDSHVTC